MSLEVVYKQFNQYRNITRTIPLKYTSYEGEYWFYWTERYIYIGDYVSTTVRLSAFSEVTCACGGGVETYKTHMKPKYFSL